ncbi:adenine phosphoribosyltransferase [symbiont of Argiope bruennichi]|uniref:adenine phosphoribosyltransferase n=1 Tax=symbiont of Argiope bruennichi TaxID=2810479 RepID=UPI003DA58D66
MSYKTNNFDLNKYVITINDFPKKGIFFRDLTPLWKDSKAFSFVIDEIASKLKNTSIDLILAPEARGFILASALSYKTGIPFLPIRKKDKVTRPGTFIEYECEYSTNVLGIATEDLKSNLNILIIDDVIATGNTTKAIFSLAKKFNCKVVFQVYLIRLKIDSNKETINSTDNFYFIEL